MPEGASPISCFLLQDIITSNIETKKPILIYVASQDGYIPAALMTPTQGDADVAWCLLASGTQDADGQNSLRIIRNQDRGVRFRGKPLPHFWNTFNDVKDFNLAFADEEGVRTFTELFQSEGGLVRRVGDQALYHEETSQDQDEVHEAICRGISLANDDEEQSAE